MEDKEDTIYSIIEVYEIYLHRKYDINVTLDIKNYSNDGLKFHEWTISPLDVNGFTFSKIRLSDSALNDILLSLRDSTIDMTIECNEDVIKTSIL